MGWEDARPPAPTVPASFPVDADARYSGVVTYYSKLKGYGFIEVAQKGVVPDDRLFVHWRDIQSEDRFPFLTKGLEVELAVMKLEKAQGPGQATLRAKLVTLPGGGSVQVQDELDAQKKEFVGGQELRYTGQLKFYSPQLGYGYVAIDPGFTALEAVPRELRVERAEVNAAGGQPPWVQAELAVEFGIWKTSRGACKAYNVTLPGGVPLTQAALEHRLVDASGGQYRGEVRVWNWQQGWGFVLPETAPERPLPQHVLAKLALQQEAARERAASRGREAPAVSEQLLYVRRQDVKPGVRLARGCQVMFQVYVDDKGAGAFDVQMI